MNPEYDIYPHISTRESEQMQRGRKQGYVDGFINQFRVSTDPRSIPREARHLIELAHLNVRLMTRDFLPLDEAQWIVAQIQIGRVPKRKMQFRTLEDLRLLRKVII